MPALPAREPGPFGLHRPAPVEDVEVGQGAEEGEAGDEADAEGEGGPGAAIPRRAAAAV